MDLVFTVSKEIWTQPLLSLPEDCAVLGVGSKPPLQQCQDHPLRLPQDGLTPYYALFFPSCPKNLGPCQTSCPWDHAASRVNPGVSQPKPRLQGLHSGWKQAAKPILAAWLPLCHSWMGPSLIPWWVLGMSACLSDSHHTGATCAAPCGCQAREVEISLWSSTGLPRCLHSQNQSIQAMKTTVSGPDCGSGQDCIQCSQDASSV